MDSCQDENNYLTLFRPDPDTRFFLFFLGGVGGRGGGYYENSADPVQTPPNAASDQGLHCLLTEISM